MSRRDARSARARRVTQGPLALIHTNISPKRVLARAAARSMLLDFGVSAVVLEAADRLLEKLEKGGYAEST